MSAQVTTGLTSKSSEFLVEDALASSPIEAPISDPEAAWAAYTRYEATGDVVHLDDAIRLFQQAIDAASEPHAKLLGWLGYCLSKRFDALGKLDNLEHAVTAQECALELVPDEHPSRALRLNGLAYSLRQRFQRLGKLDDLESAIMMQHRAVEVTPDGHPDMAVLTGYLGSLQRLRYERLGDLDDLKTAIGLQQRAVELTPDEHSDMLKQLNNLAMSLRTRFQRLGGLDDLESAIRMQRRAIELGPDGHPNMPMWLDHLAWLQHLRYERFGDLDDLEHAIAGRRQAVGLTPNGHRDMPSWLNNLGHSLRTRYERLGELDDLESAAAMQHRAVELTPDDHPDMPIWLDNLSLTKQLRYRRLGELDDLESAIRMQQRAVELTPDGHPDMALWLDNLGSLQHIRHERLGDLEDLERAIAGRRRAVALTPDGHFDMPVRLNNLGYSLSSRFQRLGEIIDLECAITAQSRAIELAPRTHSHKPLWLFNLGLSLAAHFQVERTQKGFDKVMSCLMAALDQPLVSPSWRLDAAQFAVKLLNEHSEFGAPETLLIVYTRMFDILPELVWLGHGLTRRLKESQHLRGMSNSAVYVAIKSGALAQAVEWLDAGRSFIWSQVLSIRSPVDELAQDHPDLAESFERISAQLQGTVSASFLPPEPVSVTSELPALINNAEADRHRRLAIKYGNIVADIHRQSGFGDFMKPKKLAALLPTSATLSGPVVFINVDHASCDALVLSPKGTLSTVVLPELSSEKAEALRLQWLSYLEQHNVRQHGSHISVGNHLGSRSPSVRHVLGCIWRWIMYPILKALGADDPRDSATAFLSGQ